MGYHTIRVVKSTRADTDSVDIHQTRILIIIFYQIDNPNQINLLLVVSNIMQLCLYIPSLIPLLSLASGSLASDSFPSSD